MIVLGLFGPHPIKITGGPKFLEMLNGTIKALETLGWKVITVWECELKKNVLNETLGKLIAELKAIDFSTDNKETT